MVPHLMAGSPSFYSHNFKFYFLFKEKLKYFFGLYHQQDDFSPGGGVSVIGKDAFSGHPVRPAPTMSLLSGFVSLLYFYCYHCLYFYCYHCLHHYCYHCLYYYCYHDHFFIIIVECGYLAHPSLLAVAW